MNRLPGTEISANRFEAGVFGSLATAGVAAILLALGPYSRFVTSRAAVMTTLESRPRLVLPAPANAAPFTPTNITSFETKPLATASPNKV